jgi:hypothetical protein
LEALALLDPGNAWIQRFGKKWLELRAQQRRAKFEGGGGDDGCATLE